MTLPALWTRPDPRRPPSPSPSTASWRTPSPSADAGPWTCESSSPNSTHRNRHEELTNRVGDLVDRGVRSGAIRSDLPTNWARDVLITLVDLATHNYEDLPPGPGADLVTDAFIQAAGNKP